MLGQLARRVKILASKAQALYSHIVALSNLFFKVLVMANSKKIKNRAVVVETVHKQGVSAKDGGEEEEKWSAFRPLSVFLYDASHPAA